MRILFILFSIIYLANGSPVTPSTLPDGTADKLESFPWIKASKAKARFGTTTTQSAPVVPISDQENGSGKGLQQQPAIQPILTSEMVQSYLASLAAQLQPYVIKTPDDASSSPTPSSAPLPPKRLMAPPPAASKKSWKAKVPKQINPQDVPPTTETYWTEEKKQYPDTLYDDFYLDWLRKRQVEEIMVATPTPNNAPEQELNSPPEPAQNPHAVAPPPSIPFNPYLASPFMYPLASFKLSKAMAQAQVNAALTAMNITTTQKPVKIKLKIPIPPGDDLATVVASGISGFPAGTTYELSKK